MEQRRRKREISYTPRLRSRNYQHMFNVVSQQYQKSVNMQHFLTSTHTMCSLTINQTVYLSLKYTKDEYVGEGERVLLVSDTNCMAVAISWKQNVQVQNRYVPGSKRSINITDLFFFFLLAMINVLCDRKLLPQCVLKTSNL